MAPPVAVNGESFRPAGRPLAEGNSDLGLRGTPDLSIFRGRFGPCIDQTTNQLFDAVHLSQTPDQAAGVLLATR
jgi:hypothetical protein